MENINKGGEYRQYVINIYSNQSEKSAREGLMNFASEQGFEISDVENALQVYKYDTEENAFGENYYTKVAIANMIDMISGKYAKGSTVKGFGDTKNLIGKQVKVDFRRGAIGTVIDYDNEWVTVNYPTLGFAEKVNLKTEQVTLVGKYAKGSTIKFDKLPKNRQADKNYDYFAVGKIDGKIVDGFEIVDDVESLKYYAKIDLKDNDYNPKNFNIVSAKYLIRKGINPFDYNNWRKIDYSTNESAYATKFLEGEIYANGGGVDMYSKFDINKNGTLSATINDKNYEVIYRDDISGMYDLFENDKKIKSSKVIRDLMQFPKKYADGGGIKNLDKIKISIGDTVYNHIDSLNKEQLEKQLSELKQEIQRELDNSGKSQQYFKYKDEEFFILYRLERGSEFKYADGGVLESEINDLYSKSNFINDDFNWKLKLMEMIQDRSIEAYNIYQSLTKEQKEEVLQEQFEVDNDMGSDGDGTIKTTKQNIRILLNDAKNRKKYEQFSLGGKIDNGYFNNCFLKSIFGV